jgi:exodeoxyribonuclease VII large subunit
MERATITLLELNSRIRNVLEENLSDTFWVVAEISEISVNARGHCYLELIEKAPDSDQPAAKARATIWAYTFRILQPYFETTTGRPLSAGIKVRVEAEVTFHEVYGLSLNIRDIDPAYTLGEMALKRKEIIEQLRKEGILEMNRQLPFPLVPQRIAIISSETAAGYQDFLHQLLTHPAHYHFDWELFPAMMQGREAGDTIIAALEAIYTREKAFDLVVIIRGGGSQADLSSFDSYRLAQHIAQFPLPVLTGIGHEKDETVVDLVAYESLKTPTAVAEFILDRMTAYEEKILSLATGISLRSKETLSGHRHALKEWGWQLKDYVRALLVKENHKIENILRHTAYQSKALLHQEKNNADQRKETLRRVSDLLLSEKEQQLQTLRHSLRNITEREITRHHHQLDIHNEKHTHLNPENILKRGYSITRLQGKVLKENKNIREGDILTTQLYKGNIKSKVIK